MNTALCFVPRAPGFPAEMDKPGLRSIAPGAGPGAGKKI